MTESRRWDEVWEIFHQARELPASDREPFLETACRHDPDLRSEVESLLESYETAPEFLFDPAAAEAELEALPDSLIGQQVGSYQIRSVIAEGGMGTVYGAEQQDGISRTVAVKVIKAGMDTREVVARFEMERQALALMDHPNIATVYDAGATDAGRPYFVMEYVAGIPITKYCDSHSLSTRERLNLFISVCQAIQHAHQKGVIHRDIKPSNILVVEKDGVATPKVIDFGVAKAIDQKLVEKTIFTEIGQFIGTPEYMSPEQADPGIGTVDTRTDIYSLGILLYELLVGTPPFDGATLRQAGYAEIQRFIREVEPPTPSKRFTSLGDSAAEAAACRRSNVAAIVRQLRGDLDWITLKAIDKLPARRYGTVAELAADISCFLNQEPVSAGPPSAAYRMRKFVSRHWIGVSIVTGLFLLMAIVAVAASYQSSRIAAALEQVEEQRSRAQRVSDLLIDLFKVSDPTETQGESISARQILDDGTERIRADLKDQPEVQADFLRVVGKVYDNLASYEKAAGLLEESLAIYTLSGEALKRAEVLSDLGLTLRRKGDYKGAEARHREALAVRRDLLGAEHEDTLSSMNNLGVVLRHQGLFDEAEALFREALELSIRTQGKDSLGVASKMHNLAGLLREKGDLEGPESLYREAIRIRRALLGEQHLDVAISVNSLGAFFWQAGRLDEAEEAYRQSLTLQKKILGDEHPTVAAALNNLSVLLSRMGNTDAAERLQRESLAIRREVFGDRHRDVAESLHNLGTIHYERGDLEAAQEYFAQGSEIHEEVFGKEHPRTSASYYWLGNALTSQGDLGGAERYFLRALKIQREAFPEYSSRVIRTMIALADVQRRQKKYREAETNALDAYRRLEIKNDFQNSAAQEAVEVLVRLYEELGQPNQTSRFERLLVKQ